MHMIITLKTSFVASFLKSVLKVIFKLIIIRHVSICTVVGAVCFAVSIGTVTVLPFYVCIITNARTVND